MISPSVYRFMVKPLMIDLVSCIEDDTKIKELTARTGMTYCHIFLVLNEMEKEGLVYREKEKSHYHFNRTDKGNALCQSLRDIKQIVERWEQYNRRLPKEESTPLATSPKEESKVIL